MSSPRGAESNRGRLVLSGRCPYYPDMPPNELPTLPCFPCPHNAACCAYGATVNDDEARAIQADIGGDGIYQLKSGEWRTRVRDGRCVYFRDGGCRIHGKSYYPAVCRGFPWRDSETDGPYEFDRTICPEFIERPELLEVFPFHPPPGRTAD